MGHMRTSDAAMTAACGARMSHRWFRALFARDLWSSLAALRVPPFLPPDGKDTKMEDRKYFIPVNGKRIEVSEKEYRTYYRPIWRTHTHALEVGECKCPKGYAGMCTGDCVGCQFHTGAKTVSLDTPIGDDGDEITLADTLADDAPDSDSILIEEVMLNVLCDELERLDPEGKRIFELMYDLHSEREAAEIMGIPRSTFKRQLEKVRSVLREKLKEYVGSERRSSDRNDPC